MEPRNRSLPLSLPKVERRTGETCAFCGAPVGVSHEAYSRYRYCSRRCHQEARKANAAENQKRKRVRSVQVSSIPATPAEWKCRICDKGEPDVTFCKDVFRNSGKANICQQCEKAKFAAYYATNAETIRARCKESNRKARAVPPVPKAVPDLSPRQLKAVVENLVEIAKALPSEAIPVLISALDGGRINGQVFEDRGGCGCLWGTLGRAFSWSISEEGQWAKRFRQRWCAEIELFGRIAPGDTPQSNPYAAICRTTLEQML